MRRRIADVRLASLFRVTAWVGTVVVVAHLLDGELTAAARTATVVLLLFLCAYFCRIIDAQAAKIRQLLHLHDELVAVLRNLVVLDEAPDQIRSRLGMGDN
jgi:hypothetical protein